MIIIGQPDKMLRDKRNSNGSRELSVTSMEIVVSGDNRNISNLVFSLCKSRVLGRGMRYRNVTASLLLQPTLLAVATITYRFVILLLNTAFKWSVPSKTLLSVTTSFVASY
jgi:hypothetical protein